MTQYEMRLTPVPLQMIKSGAKTIEARLFDEKGQLIQLGDEIIFTSTEDSSESIQMRVIGLLRYRSFADMYQGNDPTKFGGTSADELIKGIHEYYDYEDERRYGVLGIELERV